MEGNKLFHDRYFLERLLGRGNFSEVWLAKDTKTDIQVALKIYAPATGLDDAGLNVFAREFSLVVNANHKNLLKPLYYDSCDRKPYLVLPYCKQGSIMKQVGKFTEQEAWKLIRDVASGLAWLHGMNPPVIHQDIKPDNIMIGEKGDFMITDFGVSSHLKSTLRKSLSSAFSSAGTIAYMAPERFGKDNTPIMANDIYSLGATAFEMLAGDTPFGDDGGLVQKKGAEVPELQGDFSVQLKKVIAKCLRTNPWERPTAEQLEIYASAGMRGETIRFIDEKTFFQKHKIVIILAVVLGFASFVVGGVMLNNHRENERELRRVMAEKQYNDSLSFCIQRYLVTADSLKKIGDQHYENYEIAYLAAFENYKRAQDCTFKFIGDSVSVDEKKWEGMKSVENELYAAYKTFNEKANFFAEEKEIADDFKMRADKISTVIDIESVGKVLSDTVKTEN
ncbi:serine/threonine protein kinase [Phocaeicola sartorii]|jgi:serine/threonine protein kinase|uniref:non-specific serine/threonine protein kinase n=1 Tax=Phocaeicola sartorii TaxID=671267 RepID=R9HZ99_9BACT|nr:serine/threonine-protein kinase [Phocaeicola sartorii]EOS09131.1 hypothetical protein C802_04124 [Phocaeicola sartorii]MCR1846182.1 serine/threonine protein kinase [Phocaeicola sartorii]NBH67900.1 serine/threonine protein kinase [Phocaeicola sartorii]NUL01016.1 serine/threonine protein kinase [Phocaeicola sartorii]